MNLLPTDTIYTYYVIIDYIPYAVLYIPMTTFTTGNLYILNIIPCPPIFPSLPPIWQPSIWRTLIFF